MEIIEAIQRLDPSNDEHWTGDGEPRVDAVGELLGRAVTRAEINRAGNFRRPDTESAETSEEERTPESEAPPADPRDQAAEFDFGDPRGPIEFDEIPEASDDPFTVEGGPEDPAERLAWLEFQMERIGRLVRRGQEALQALNREYQSTQKEAPLPTPEERFKADRAHYKRTQAILRADRAERLQMLRESNVDLKALQSVIHPSQLDAAMSRKSGRGGARPQFHPDASPKQEPGTS